MESGLSLTLSETPKTDFSKGGPYGSSEESVKASMSKIQGHFKDSKDYPTVFKD